MNIALLGFGTVGQGLAKVIKEKKETLKKRYSMEINIVGVADSSGAALNENGLDVDILLKSKEKGSVSNYPKFGRDLTGSELIKESNADLIVEATPTNISDGEPGNTHIRCALKEKMHVVTSNKGPLALFFSDLVGLAERNKVEFRYEASVGGAMPIINLARETLAGNEILAIVGILNGTTNYILTRMLKEEEPFSYILKEAQELGIAEADPTLDISGVDTACKLVILANTLMNMKQSYRDVKVEGITRITPEAMELAWKNGYVIKLIGEARNSNLEVGPRLVPAHHPLSVEGTLNVAMLETDLAGEVTVVGRGAGQKETCSALLSDIIAIHKKMLSEIR
ncbi:MAG: homoserine dehydrogenase [Candidatus Hydrothermarchaeota archaeon]